MNIWIHTIPKGEPHRCGYETQGDWWYREDGELQVSVSEMGDKDAEFAVSVHELIEAWICKKNGITEADVSAFDRLFEAERDAGTHSEMAEPGDDPRAPYRKEHQAATLVEMLVLTLLGKSWPDHCNEVANERGSVHARRG